MSNDYDGKQIMRLWKLQAKVNMLVLDGKRDAEAVATALQSILDTPPSSWREEDGVIYFSVVSDGTTGKDWIKRLEGNGFRVEDYAKQVLRTPSFEPTNGVTTKVAVLRGCLFEDNDRITKKIRAEADKRKLGKPEPELACLIRLKFTDKDIKAMGLWNILAMHKPIGDSDRYLSLLGVGRHGGGRLVDAYYDRPGRVWDRVGGFAFVAQ